MGKYRDICNWMCEFRWFAGLLTLKDSVYRETTKYAVKVHRAQKRTKDVASMCRSLRHTRNGLPNSVLVRMKRKIRRTACAAQSIFERSIRPTTSCQPGLPRTALPSLSANGDAGWPSPEGGDWNQMDHPSHCSHCQ